MDGNYEINSTSLSLTTLCAVKVARRVLLASAGGRLMVPIVEDDAAKKVRELKLQPNSVEILENFIPPMRREMEYWHQMFYSSAEDLIMTPFGTVDWMQSAKVLLLNKKKNKVTRFAVACFHCFEDVIYELFSELTENDWYVWHTLASNIYCFPMVKFWRDAFLGRFGPVATDGRLPQKAYNRGFKIAIKSQNDFAVKHFIRVASPKIVRKWFSMPVYFDLDFFKCPSTFSLLVSKLCETDQQKYLPELADYFLLTLIELWPYQGYFEEAVYYFISHVTEINYWFIVEDVLEEIVDCRSDADYYRLFRILWLAGSCHRHGSTNLSRFSDIIFDIIMLKHEQLINFVLKETCTKLKDVLLMKFSENKICIRLIHKKEFRLLKLFIRCCGLGRRKKLLEFKTNFLAYYSSSSNDIWFEDFKGDWKRDDCEAGLRQFAKIMNKILTKKRPAKEMTQ